MKRVFTPFILCLFLLVSSWALLGGSASAHTVVSAHKAVVARNAVPASTCFQEGCSGQEAAAMTNCGNDVVNGSVYAIDGYGHTVGILYLYSSGATNGCMANFAYFTLDANESLKYFWLHTIQTTGTWADNDIDYGNSENYFGQNGPYPVSTSFSGFLYGYEGTHEDCARSEIQIGSNNGTEQTYYTNWYCNP